ncbi:DUF488 family protein [bacterium]|nr:DUF488 family protein [bacterium]
MPILTKMVKEPRAPEDGTRLLVMRLWPRGVKKAHVDAWERDLAPSVELMRGFLKGRIPWAAYRKRYVAEVREREEKLEEIRRRSSEGETITLLCWCHDETRCHRSLLRGLLVPERGP